ncbi:hypothetical protein [Motiliproteus sp. MSK22-1]|uniref:hypothetical protein n=1 Tax=Motiliproteus sp. MSK22-1 TaxID=1897630 RepID=UPI0009763CBB|nr:hypothetical protein [Motiliproteus sp. MSK22-1]OMH30317.1 hypothetical protein BGP75_18195 [Motiliproteus sp. MSK22-1]
MSRGAGGTTGGAGQFFIGFAMMCGGFYMLLQSISVTSSFGMGMRLYSLNMYQSQMHLTSGMVIIPMIFGIGIIFYNSKNLIGWLLFLGASTALIFGVISSIHFQMRHMTAFELVVIVVLSFGGLGLFLRSLKDFSR